MTETALNERIAALAENDAAASRRKEKELVRRRRTARVLRDDREMRIIRLYGWKPYVGSLDRDFRGHTLAHSGYHVRQPKSSVGKTYLKFLTGRAMRNCREDVPVKGNYYRRLVDLWWELS